MCKIGFIGAGNMGGALIAAACKSIPANEVIIADCLPQKALASAAETGCRTAASNEEVVKSAKYIVLAVKPDIIRDVVDEIAPVLAECIQNNAPRVLVTIAAGVSTLSIREHLRVDMPVIRIMPNTPVMVGEGMILLTGSGPDSSEIPEEMFTEFTSLMGAAGEFERIKETAIDYTTSVSSCAPAFVYMFIEALADGAVQVGVPRPQALKLAAKTVLGSAAMVLESGMHPGALKDAVCSPGGSTIVGVETLEKYGFRHAVAQAIVQSTQKNLQLGK